MTTSSDPTISLVIGDSMFGYAITSYRATTTATGSTPCSSAMVITILYD